MSSYFIITICAIEWGSISDWGLVAVTTITAVFLYRTLQSQKEVQATQTKLFEIESIRFRESVKPKLKYVVSTEMFKPGNENEQILTILVTNETEGMALEITPEYAQNGNVRPIFIPINFDSRRRHLAKSDQPILLHFLINPQSLNFVVFGLIYKDIAGVEYKQRVFCIADAQGTEVNPFLPEVIPA
ncbi:MAG TPA: hypothetical protein VL978_16370 [Puia sp.]|nr:hypothetical protein [Puia sp.]